MSQYLTSSKIACKCFRVFDLHLLTHDSWTPTPEPKLPTVHPKDRRQQSNPHFLPVKPSSSPLDILVERWTSNPQVQSCTCYSTKWILSPLLLLRIRYLSQQANIKPQGKVHICNTCNKYHDGITGYFHSLPTHTYGMNSSKIIGCVLKEKGLCPNIVVRAAISPTKYSHFSYSTSIIAIKLFYHIISFGSSLGAELRQSSIFCTYRATFDDPQTIF